MRRSMTAAGLHIRFHLNLIGIIPRPRKIISKLHPHKMFHPGAESLFNPQRHLRRQRCLFIQKIGQRLAGNAKSPGRNSPIKNPEVALRVSKSR
jgi:hypothetical protein